jgi:hypothetical protein
MSSRFLGVPWLFWGLAMLAPATVFALIWPRGLVVAASPLRYLILRWAHALVWLLLGLSCFLRVPLQAESATVANGLMVVAGAVYLVFVLTLVSRQAQDRGKG